MRERRCIVTGEVLPEAQLIRFVADPDAHIVPDIAAKLPGRGFWVRAKRETIAKAVSKNLFARAAEASVKADADLPQRTEKLLMAAMLNTLGMARRAGELIPGFEKVDAALRGNEPPALIVEASEASEDGQRKLQAAAHAKGRTPFVIGCFTSAELGLALGLENVVHASVKAGRFAERLVFDAGRLEGFRSIKPLAWNGFSGRESKDASGLWAPRMKD
jgi:predicted RNA-binding protein YlxR (DUF448 family)